MSFRTKYLPLTKEQKARGVIYSSRLIVTNNPYIDNSTIHEVTADDPRRDEHIRNLKDVSFFKSMAEDCGWNVINEVRR